MAGGGLVITTVLGLDSGGTKTLAALADRDGRVLRLWRGGSLDPVSVPDWPERLEALVTGLAPEASVLGLPYHGEIADLSQRQQDTARALLPGRVLVDNDVRIAFDGAFAGGPGALILAGTGSMAWASLGGPQHRSGGWGDLFGDEGSAYWIGREALAALSRELDGRLPPSRFSAGLLRALGVGPEAVLDWCQAQDHQRSAIAGLARVVATLAEAGDPVAITILTRAAEALAETLQAAWRNAAGPRPLRWSHAGGVMTNPLIQRHITALVGVAPEPCRLPPVGGALLRAAHLAGWETGADWVDRVASGLAEALA